MSDPQDKPPAPAALPATVKDGPGHSDIFDRLSAGQETDLIGLVAYGLYQRRKRCWIEDFRHSHGRFPTSEERDSYAFGYREDAIEALRREAEGAMATFAEEAIQQQLPELRTDALGAETRAVLSGIDEKLTHLGTYSHHIVGHLVGFLVLVGIVALGSFIVRYEPSIEGAYQWFFGKHQEAPASHASPKEQQ
jgi:hypothetical protein